jgi:hypothetical protein
MVRQFFILTIFSLVVTAYLCAQAPDRTATDKNFKSGRPQLDLRLNERFKYAGSFDFTVPNFSNGQRYVYVDADSKRNVRRMFILQFEQILADSSEKFNYDLRSGEKMRQYLFRHNTFAFSNKAGKLENANSEGVLTVAFLEKKGYRVSDEWMASRFVTVPDVGRKGEIIIFYLEAIERTGHTLGEFYKGEERTNLWQGISDELAARSRRMFTLRD